MKKICERCNGTGSWTNCFDQIFTCTCRKKKKKRSKEPKHSDIIMLGLYVCLMTKQNIKTKREILKQAEVYLLKRKVLKDTSND